MFARTSAEKLDNKKHTVILSHLPISFWDTHFVVKVINVGCSDKGRTDEARPTKIENFSMICIATLPSMQYTNLSKSYG